MRSILGFLFVLIVITLTWNWLQRPSARQPTQRLITLRVQPPPPSPPQSVTVSEGYAVEVQWSIGERFALRPIVLDDAPGPVRVTIEAPEDRRALDDLVLANGAPGRETKTSPRFTVQVVEIEER